jgi:hypothetical protein
MMLNGRYSDLERRIIEAFRVVVAAKPGFVPWIVIPDRLQILVAYLIHDGLVEGTIYISAISTGSSDGTKFRDDNLKLPSFSPIFTNSRRAEDCLRQVRRSRIDLR